MEFVIQRGKTESKLNKYLVGISKKIKQVREIMSVVISQEDRGFRLFCIIINVSFRYHKIHSTVQPYDF